MKTKKKAISLIVLVVTIIVLAILAATVIISIGNAGIINSATKTVKDYDLSQVRNLANMAYAEALMDSTVNTNSEYNTYISEYLENQGVDFTKYVVNSSASGTNVIALTATEPHPDQDLEDVIGLDSDGNLVDMDVWYYFPITNADGEVTGYCLGDLSTTKTYNGNFVGGAIETKIPAYIMDSGESKFMPVTQMFQVFGGLEELEVMPEIPNNVEFLSYTFADGCGLKVASKIPDSVTKLFYTFRGNTSLTTVEDLPDSITEMYFAFNGCTSLSAIGKLPKNVVNLNTTFAGCTSLVTAPIIPENVEIMQSTFGGCTNLTGTVRINSQNVTNFVNTFYGITNDLIVQVPAESTTYSTLVDAYGSSENITIETFIP